MGGQDILLTPKLLNPPSVCPIQPEAPVSFQQAVFSCRGSELCLGSEVSEWESMNSLFLFPHLGDFVN